MFFKFFLHIKDKNHFCDIHKFIFDDMYICKQIYTFSLSNETLVWHISFNILFGNEIIIIKRKKKKNLNFLSKMRMSLISNV